MGRKLLLGFNWLAAGLLAGAFLLAALMPANFINKEDWASPVVLIVFTMGFLIIINGVRKLIDGLSPRSYHRILWMLGILLIIVQILVAVHFVDASKADVYFVRNQAIELAQGGHTWDYYFKVYPNNVNSALFEAMLLRPLLKLGVTSPWIILNVFRFIWLDTALLSGLLILKHWQRWRPGALYLLLTWLFSLPVYTYGLISYNDATVMPLILDVMVLGWVFNHHRGGLRWLAGIGTWLLLGFALIMKSNLVVLYIAILITLVIATASKKVKWQPALIWLVGSVLTVMLCLNLATTLAKNNGYKKNVNQATPVTSWIAMSLNPERQGQYEGSDFYPIRELKTQAEKKKAAGDSIQNRIDVMGPVGLAGHLFDKLGVFLSHGDADATIVIGQWIKVPAWYLQHQRSFKFWALLMTQCWYLVLLIGSIYQLFKQRKHMLLTGSLSLTILGLTAFHVLIWEVEPRYSLPLFPILMLLGAAGWSTIPTVALNRSRQFGLSWIMFVGVLIGGLSIVQTSRNNPTSQINIAHQVNGYYFKPTIKTIDPGARYHFQIQLNGLKNNQLTLAPRTDNKLTVQISTNEKIIKTAKNRAQELKQINYPTTQARRLKITIINDSHQPAMFNAGINNFDLNSGQILSTGKLSLLWGVNHAYPSSTTVTNQQQVVKMTPNKLIVIITFIVLALTQWFIWWNPGKRTKVSTSRQSQLK